MKFDYTSLTDTGIDFGVVRGSGKIVFIKVGLGGSCLGYEDKYVKIARRLNELYGCSVIVVSNPQDNRSHVASDRAIIEKYLSENNFSSCELFFFGHSNGGFKGLELSASGIGFKKMLLINMPLTINPHKTRRYVSASPGAEITLVYGNLDPSFSYIPFIEGKYENLKVITVQGADHNFEGMLPEFIELSDLLMSE